MDELTDRDVTKWMTVARSLIKQDAPRSAFFVPLPLISHGWNVCSFLPDGYLNRRLHGVLSGNFSAKEKKGGKFCVSSELLPGLRKWLSSSTASCLQRGKKKSSFASPPLLARDVLETCVSTAGLENAKGGKKNARFARLSILKCVLNSSEGFIRDYERQSNSEISGSTFFYQRWKMKIDECRRDGIYMKMEEKFRRKLIQDCHITVFYKMRCLNYFLKDII